MKLSRARCVVLRWVLTALVGLICVLIAGPAAADPVRVVVIRPEPSGPLLDEALIRIRGELSAVGLGVEIRAPDPETPEGEPTFGPLDYGIVELRATESQIEIRAHAPGLDSPVVQTADPHHPGINAEVIAIRTVEALRAAMIQYARRKQARREALPKELASNLVQVVGEAVPARSMTPEERRNHALRLETASDREREKFARLGPIDPRHVRLVDFDILSKRLQM